MMLLVLVMTWLSGWRRWLWFGRACSEARDVGEQQNIVMAVGPSVVYTLAGLPSYWIHTRRRRFPQQALGRL